MNRRELLALGVGATTAVRMAGAARGAYLLNGLASDEGDPLARLPNVDPFNYVIGTQAIGATYQFTQESLLVETARAILDMGSNILKITMGRDYRRTMLKPSRVAHPDTKQRLPDEGSPAKKTPRIEFPGASLQAQPADPEVQSLTDLARLEPSYRQVFEMPFAYYLIWTYAFAPGWWLRGFSHEDQDKEYTEIRGFVAHLLKSYSGTGKSFLLGHWEGDWHLRPSLKVDSDREVTPESIQGMTDWLNIRQKAVDDAKLTTPHHGVQVYHYTEANHVTLISMAGRPSVANSILPKTNVDYVSYSSYDSLADIPRHLPKALQYLDDRISPKLGIPGKRVFIGEYGFPARGMSEVERDRRSRQVMRIGLEWGCPFILCWQMYNNEFTDGHENGYWLIDDKGVKQPLWHTHHDFYQQSRRYVADFLERANRPPTSEEFRRFALGTLARN